MPISLKYSLFRSVSISKSIRFSWKMWAYVAAAELGTPAAWKNFTHESIRQKKISDNWKFNRIKIDIYGYGMNIFNFIYVTYLHSQPFLMCVRINIVFVAFCPHEIKGIISQEWRRSLLNLSPSTPQWQMYCNEFKT